MGEKGNLDPATVTATTGGDSVLSSTADAAVAGGQKLSDAVIAETTGAVIGTAAARITEKRDQGDDDPDPTAT